ncbi:SDR family NAD(P)-dependent oxidoreductase [bacterium]|nr:SDR family NAD(P)-dependent oxidoreductase [bacterium]
MKILITGASSGIGKATALLLARKGHDVFMVARRKEKLEEIARTSSTVVGTLLVDELDVTNKIAIQNFCENHKDWLKGIDVLINNAGLALGQAAFPETTDEDHDTMIATNITGLLTLTRAILPLMKANKWGHVLNLGSVAGITPYKGGTTYCATKAAVHMITDCLRMDLGGTGIRVSTVAPGRVAETEFSEVRYKGDMDKAKSVYEGYRTMTSNDVAENIAWIVEQPKHINIQELVILPTDQPSATTLDPLK